MWRPIIILALFLPLLGASAPATSPTTQPTAELSADSPARKWFADLASPDATTRDDAQTKLMGLNRDDLSALRTLIIKSLPIAPSQAAAMHDIVTHVFLRGETYPFDPNNTKGFLGLRWADPNEFPDGIPHLGVPVEIRLPGFPSFQLLRDGDLILGVIVDKKRPLNTPPNLPTPTREILTGKIADAGANHDVVFEVLRQGQVIQVSLRLLPRPSQANSIENPEAFTAERDRRAEEYWQKEFAPLLRQDL